MQRWKKWRRLEPLDEFERIAKLMAPLAAGEAGAFGLTDDAAVLTPKPGEDWVVTKDAIVAGVHFTGKEAAGDIARKLMRVNLSDLAAMGAEPRAYLIAAMLPHTIDDLWVADFCAGLKLDQEQFGGSLVGGDTSSTPGPLCFSLTAIGTVPTGQALRRKGAQAGDLVMVSGTLGDGALGLKVVQGALSIGAEHDSYLRERYQLPQPRLALGKALRGIATSCMDISDGLLQDLGHICAVSGVGANLKTGALPLSPAAQAALAKDASLIEAVATGGDDYELLFTIPPGKKDVALLLSQSLALPLTVIGEITAGSKVILQDESGATVAFSRAGYRHGNLS